MANHPDRASYFPAIEKKYGQPMAYWHEQMIGIKDLRYPEQMAWLQDNHGFSRTHANALVLYSRGSTSSRRYDTFDGYLAAVDVTQAATLRSIFACIQGAYPDLDLVIAWNQPMLKRGGDYIFGAGVTKAHILIAPFDTEVLDDFRPRLTDFHVNKKTIRIPSDWLVDCGLLVDMIAACLVLVGDAD